MTNLSQERAVHLRMQRKIRHGTCSNIFFISNPLRKFGFLKEIYTKNKKIIHTRKY